MFSKSNLPTKRTCLVSLLSLGKSQHQESTWDPRIYLRIICLIIVAPQHTGFSFFMAPVVFPTESSQAIFSINTSKHGITHTIPSLPYLFVSYHSISIPITYTHPQSPKSRNMASSPLFSSPIYSYSPPISISIPHKPPKTRLARSYDTLYPSIYTRS